MSTPEEREMERVRQADRQFAVRKPHELRIIPTLDRADRLGGRSAEDLVALGIVEPRESAQDDES